MLACFNLLFSKCGRRPAATHRLSFPYPLRPIPSETCTECLALPHGLKTTLPPLQVIISRIVLNCMDVCVQFPLKRSHWMFRSVRCRNLHPWSIFETTSSFEIPHLAVLSSTSKARHSTSCSPPSFNALFRRRPLGMSTDPVLELSAFT